MQGESPIFLEENGTFAGELTGFYYSTRLRYAIGKKMYTFSAKGPWDAIVVNATTLESAPGRFATAAFITPPRPAQVEEVYPERIYPDAPAGPMDFVTKCGLTLNLVVYGSLFSASLRTDLGMEFATKSGTPFFAPQFDADAGIALYSVDSCRKCPSVKLVGSAFVNKVLLDVSLGTFVSTDLVGPSGSNTAANLQKSLLVDIAVNKPEVVEKSVMCLYTKFGINSTSFCGLQTCCNSSSTDTCNIGQDLKGECVSQ
jgi:hypothetical protein